MTILSTWVKLLEDPGYSEEKLGFEEMDRFLEQSIEMSSRSLQVIGDMVWWLHAVPNIGEMDNENFAYIGDLIQEFTVFMEGCRELKESNLKDWLKDQYAGEDTASG